MTQLPLLTRTAACLLAWLAAARVVLAHAGGAHADAPASARPRDWGELWTTWGLEPGTLVPLALSALLYGRGVWRMWRQAGPGRGIRPWEVACFGGGWLTLVVALVSPLHPWGNVLFAAHM